VDSAEPGFRVEPLDETGRLFQIFLKVRGAPAIYFSLPSAKAERQLQAGLSALLDWSAPSKPISLVEHPFWHHAARALSASRMVYDRMDYHQGFETFAEEVVSSERDLMTEADLTVVSSDWLDRDTARYTSRRVLIRNATDYEHFAATPANVFRDERGRRTIGYFGAIAGWMDLDLVAAVANRYPDCLVLLIGHDQVGAARRLRRLPNVRFLGEVPYSELPHYLHGFDVCMLPRRVLPLTEAMNPVKLYEYLSAGLPVVAVDLPELRHFGDLVYVASSPEKYLEDVGRALNESPGDSIVERRRAFAARQTWDERTSGLIASVESPSLSRINVGEACIER
jgi:glycosyltransferase involved in cell wall biosynthesis